MSYTINLTDGALFATIADGTINTSSSMTLVGKNYAGYGQFLDTNFIHLLENASNTTPPGAPLTGQLWWDLGNKLLKVYQGSTWKSISGATASTTPPSTSISVAGDLWYDSTNAQLNVYTGASWLLVGPQSSQGQGTTGAIAATITDTSSVPHVVLELYTANTIVGMVSKDATFTPNVAVPGFSTISPGLQLSSNVSNALFQGTATNSQALNGLSSNQFMRSDANTSTSGTLSVINNSGLSVGLNSNFNANVSGTTVTLKNITSNGNLNIGVNVGGTPTDAILIDGSTGVVSIPSLSLGNSANISFSSLGIGTAATGNVGEIVATNNITAYYSDDRLKTRLGDIKNALDAVTSLTGFYYEANQTAQDLGYTVQREVGLSAQDVQKILPEVVVPAPIDSQYLTIRYEKMIPLLVQAIKELNDKIDNLSK
jgi:Chaperone of endosialidase